MSPRARAIAASLLGAALLFTVQPYVARLVLPRLGGSPSVWSTCQVFFQAALLLGYAYAHASTRWLTPRRQAALHLVVLALPLAALPIGVPAGWAPSGGDHPTSSLLSLLLRAVLVPFAVVATTAPLVQRWYSRSGAPDAAEPYSLYAASNVGSLVGLLAYPLLIEPTMTLGAQGQVWAAGYLAFAAVVASCACPSLRGTDVEPAPAAVQAADEPSIGRWQAARWVALSAAPSALLLGVTSHISTDVVSMPLLWAVPLALYLATFIHAFAARPWFPADLLASRTPLLLLVPAFLLLLGSRAASLPAWVTLPAHLLALTVVATACHGALAASRPAPSRLTAFYLLMSLGGVVGGILGGLLPPLVLDSVAEYPAALVVACALLGEGPRIADAATVRWRDLDRRPALRAAALGVLVLVARVAAVEASDRFPGGATAALSHPATIATLATAGAATLGWRRPRSFGLALAAVLLATSLDLGVLRVAQGFAVIDTERSFFGVHRVVSVDLGLHSKLHLLEHGTTLHGGQFADALTDQGTRAREPLAYYSRGGPVGWLLPGLASRPQGDPRHVAVVGLGAGALAAWAEPGQRMTFFEIDPAVARIAQDLNLFSYVFEARVRGADVPPPVIGDARVTIGRASAGAFDLLVLDAFSSDAIPAHLLTREAFAGWMRALAPGGVLLCHVTNRTLDVRRLVGDLAADAGLVARLAVDDGPPASSAIYRRSRWVAIARAEADLGPAATDPRWVPLEGDPARAWTDDFSSVLGALRQD